MTKLLLKWFVQGSQNPEDPTIRAKVGTLAGVTGIVCNLLLFAVKLIVGFVSGAVSVMADAMNNLSDAASSVVTLLGFRLAKRPADADHPYGHARYEYLSALVVSVLILFIGVELVKTSVSKILDPQLPSVSLATLIILFAAIDIKLWMSGFFRKLGKWIRSGALEAAGIDSRNDCIATLGVLVSCLIGYFFEVNVDGWVGLAVAMFILWSGIQVARETISPLLGKRADRELVGKLSELVLSHQHILGIHDLLVHDYGPGQCYASVHAELSAELDSLYCHDIIDDIECDALAELNVHLVIHYDPVVTNDAEWQNMRRTVEMIVEKMDTRLSVHDFRLVRGANKTKLVFDLAVPYGSARRHRDWKADIDRALAEQDKNYATVIRFDKKED